ncbi:MAG: hypothetical protein AAGI70_13415 [Pseudomonadota bacterium]
MSKDPKIEDLNDDDLDHAEGAGHLTTGYSAADEDPENRYRVKIKFFSAQEKPGSLRSR